MNLSILKQPSAFLPIAMSLVALAPVLAHAVLYGGARETEKGTLAHVSQLLFQFLMVTQVPVVAFFAIRWLPRTPGPALVVLALQMSAALVVVAAVFFLT